MATHVHIEPASAGANRSTSREERRLNRLRRKIAEQLLQERQQLAIRAACLTSHQHRSSGRAIDKLTAAESIIESLVPDWIADLRAIWDNDSQTWLHDPSEPIEGCHLCVGATSGHPST